MVPPAVGSALFFWYVLVLRGDLSDPAADDAAVSKALGFFILFAAMSLAFWGYFRWWDDRPTRKYAAEPTADETYEHQLTTSVDPRGSR